MPKTPASEEAAAKTFRSKLLTAVLFLLSRFVLEMIQGYSFFFFSSFYVLDISSLKVKVVNWPHKCL